ncbi:hypothetical protein FV225_28450, partial [Methylobacterium sp. WL93]
GFGYEGFDPVFDVIRAKTDLYGALRARLGFAFERALIYATQAGRPPSSTQTSRTPKVRSIHHTRGAENRPCPS